MSALDNPDGISDKEEVDGELGQFVRLKRMVIAGHRARSDWRKEAIRAFDFVANYQWSEDDKRILDEQSRPAITFNRVAPIIKAVCGLEVNNRQGIVFLPRTQGDVGINEAYTAAAKWVRDECDAEDEESEAFRDLTICGEGWTETRMDFDEEKQGQIVEERVDPLEMGQFGGSKANYKDSRLVYRFREMEIMDARDLFPGLEAAAINAAWLNDDIVPADGGTGNKKDYPNETRGGLNRAGSTLTKCRVVQVQWWERETIYLLAQEGVPDLQELSAEDFAKFSERAKAMGIKYDHVGVPQKVYYEAYLGASGLLPFLDENSQQVTQRKLSMGMFQFRCMTGERDRKGKCFYGMMRDMFDPQMWANKWLSQNLAILNSNAKGGIMAETDAFVNQRKAERDWTDPTKIVWTKPGAISGQKIKERTAPPLPNGMAEMMNFALTSLRDTTGVNLELLGQADREQAASLEAQRRQSAMTILATLFDSLRRYRKGQGRLLLHFIQMLPNGTLVRVLDNGQYKYIPLMKDDSIEKFDVIVDEAPSSPNQKQAVWAMVTQLLQSGMQFNPQTVITLLKYSPLPESVVQEVREAMGLAEKMPPEMLQEKLAQAEAALQVMEQQLQEALDNAKTAEDDRAIEMMKLEIDEYKAETDRLSAMWTAQQSAQQATQDAAETPNPSDEGGAAPGGTGGGNEEVLASLQEQVGQISAAVQALTQLLGGEQQQEQPEAPVEFDPEAAPPQPEAI